MISLDAQTQTSTSSPSPIVTPANEDEPTLSFSQLLKGATTKKDTKGIQNGALVLSLENNPKDTKNLVDVKETKSSSKTSSLLSLLKNEDKELSNSKDPLEINPKVTSSMSVKEVKNLVADAKEYLKAQIVDSDGYKNSQNKELPQTLKGLAQMAKNFGIDVSKITIEEVQPKGLNPKDLTPKESSQKVATTNNTQDSSLQKGSSKAELNSDKKVLSQHPVIEDKKVKVKTPTLDTQKGELKDETPKNTQVSEKATPVANEIKSTPLFKAQTTTEHTTEQLVQTKTSGLMKGDEKSSKNRADETLQLLLRGEKPSKTSAGMTADFSVATARVIAPSSTTEATKSLESLLHGESKEPSNSNSKLDGLTTLKADSFEVKLGEAKQMIKYLSNDVKTAIEDYKSPFTRVKVQLNPQKLGEVDVTIIQRGKNLHVNISSNNTAINTLSMNANELKTQLTNSGINNASLNFNNSSQNSEQNASQQQQNRQNERQANEEYNYFDNEEANEEILSSLEIVVPNYA